MRLLALGAALGAVLVAATGCSDSSAADGPRKQICGEWIGRAEVTAGSGPWYVDAAQGSTQVVAAAAGASGTWVRVSSDCGHGVRVSVSDHAVIKVADSVTAKDGTDVAVLVQPRTAGRATLIKTSPSGVKSKIITFTITHQNRNGRRPQADRYSDVRAAYKIVEDNPVQGGVTLRRASAK